ncbi:MAG: transcription antitermination factor NusB [Oscillospiraceae bacterium]|jgi:N utilization substance protein B|nr:transcription antitermination factor NusB [Oscillospiraceae bacterium]
MDRRAQRERAFLLVFERSFHICDADEEVAPMKSYFDDKIICGFTRQIFEGVQKYEQKIDKIISSSIVGWDKNRLSRVVLCILKLAVYEMLFEDDIPVGVSINEAVEITKKYGAEKSSSFVNGVLGIIAVRLETSNSKVRK